MFKAHGNAFEDLTKEDTIPLRSDLRKALERQALVNWEKFALHNNRHY